VIRAFLVACALGAIVAFIIWERSVQAKTRQVFFSIYNKAAKNKKGNQIHGVSVNVLDIMDETDIPPNKMHTILKEMEKQQYVTFKGNVVKLTTLGVAYFRMKYTSEKGDIDAAASN
jgi:predicted methyltransferase